MRAEGWRIADADPTLRYAEVNFRMVDCDESGDARMPGCQDARRRLPPRHEAFIEEVSFAVDLPGLSWDKLASSLRRRDVACQTMDLEAITWTPYLARGASLLLGFFGDDKHRRHLLTWA